MSPQDHSADVENDELQEEPTEAARAESTDADQEPSPAASDFGVADDEVQQLTDRALRLQAELDNVRKRAARETGEIRRYATASLALDLLTVLDNMERAVAAAKESAGAESLVEGFRLVVQQLQDMLAKHHCTKIEAIGKPFDPNLHEAIGQQPSETEAPGTVITVVQEGYQLHDRVLRPTRVMIAAPPVSES